jgi:hypothetical protein
MFNEELQIVPFWKSMLNYSYLGECVQLIHPLVVTYGLWLIKLKIVE